MKELDLTVIPLVGGACLSTKAVDNIDACQGIYDYVSRASGVVKATGIKRRRVVENGFPFFDLCYARA